MEHLNSRKIALIAIFAALYYAMSYLPGIPAIGAPKVKIQLEAFMASIFGLILGPYLGALTAFLSGFVAWVLPPGSPGPIGLVMLPAMVINALVTGLIYNGRWKSASMLLSLLIVFFWLLPPSHPIEQNFLVGIAATWDKILALLLMVPTAHLMKRISHPESSTTIHEKVKKFNWASFLSLVSAILVLVNAYMISTGGNVLRLEYQLGSDTYRITFGSKDYIAYYVPPFGYLWLLTGIGILTGAILLHIKPDHNTLWSILILVASGLSSVIGGGFIAGLILGALGGLLGFFKAKVHFQRLKPLNIEVLTFFLLAYIGIQADNAWGNFVYAIPIIHDEIFAMTLEAVRASFLISPFSYFIMRVIQAIFAALVASPLINNLRAAGFMIPLKTPKIPASIQNKSIT
ncbi:MAG: ECF transporter S component [Candidatus Bathyarchaeia archaeon]